MRGQSEIGKGRAREKKRGIERGERGREREREKKREG